MQKLYLMDILPRIGGILRQGKGNPLVVKVVNRYQDLAEGAIMFDINQGKILRGNSAKKLRKAVVVTQRPEAFAKLNKYLYIVKVSNCHNSYWNFVEYYRSLFNLPIVGLTGTAGKTTTKEMIKHILEENNYKVQATVKSKNASFRNLDYLLGIDQSKDAAVIEMGVAYPGNLRESVRYFKPNIRLLLNIGVYHLNECKTPHAYRKAKEELFENLDPNSILILNKDDEYIRKIPKSKLIGKVMYFSLKNKADFQAEGINYNNKGMSFRVNYLGESHETFVKGYGDHTVYNALAAIAASVAVGLSIKEACKGLSSFKQMEEHLEFKQGINKSVIIDDTWNSSPPSMEAALKVLKEVGKSKTKIAVLGYMPRLGNSIHAKKEYLRLGKIAAQAGLSLLVVVGDQCKQLGYGAIKGGLHRSKVVYCSKGHEVYDCLSTYLKENTMVLLKVPHRLMQEKSFNDLKTKMLGRWACEQVLS